MPSTSVDLDVHDREAGQHAAPPSPRGCPSSIEGMYSRGIVPPTILLIELVAAALRFGLHVDDGVAVLAAAARLADELGRGCLHGLRIGLAVGHLRPADVGVDLELAHQPVDDDLQVQLAHAGDDRLAGLLVGAHAERGVLLGQPRSAAVSFSWSALVFGSMATSMTGSGKSMLSSSTGASGSHSVSPVRRLLEADGGDDVAGPRSARRPRGGWRASRSSRPTRSLRPVPVLQHVGARVELAGVDAEVGQLADERVGHDLERERREGLVQRAVALASARRSGSCPSPAARPAARAGSR